MVEMSFGAAPEPQPSLEMVEDMASTAVVVNEIFPAQCGDPAQRGRHLGAFHAEGGAGEHHGRGVAALARYGDDAHQQERHDHADGGHDGGLPEGDAESQCPCAVRHGEHRDVRGEPRPEQAGRRAFSFLFGNGVYALFLDGEGTFILAHFRLCLLRFPALSEKVPVPVAKRSLSASPNRSDTS